MFLVAAKASSSVKIIDYKPVSLSTAIKRISIINTKNESCLRD